MTTMDSAFDVYQREKNAQERELYNSYLKILEDMFARTPKDEGFEIYDKGFNRNLMTLATKTFAEKYSDQYHIVMDYYTDIPDPDGPYGFIRSYYRFTVSKVKPVCPTCSHKS